MTEFFNWQDNRCGMYIDHDAHTFTTKFGARSMCLGKAVPAAARGGGKPDFDAYMKQTLRNHGSLKLPILPPLKWGEKPIYKTDPT